MNLFRVLITASSLALPITAGEPCVQLQSPETLTALPANFVTFEPVQRSADGNILLLGRNGTSVQLYTYDVVAETWLAPFALGSVWGSLPDMMVDLTGTITVAWVDEVSGMYQLTTRRFVPGSGWELPEIAFESIDGISRLDLEADALGNTLVAFQAGSLNYRLSAVYRDHQTGVWSPEIVLRTPTNLGAPNIVTNTSHADVLLFFVQSTGPESGMDVYTWDANTLGWSAANFVPGTEEIWPAWGNELDSEILAVIDANGEATVVWQELLQPFGYYTRTSQTIGGVWQNPTPQIGPFQGPTDVTYELQAADITADGEIVMAVGAHVSQGHDAYALHYDPISGWDPPHFLGSYPEATDSRIHPRVAFYDGDRAVALIPMNHEVRGYHFNGSDWSLEELAVPARVTEDELVVSGLADRFFVTSIDVNGAEYVASHLQGRTGFSDVGFALAGTNGAPSLVAECDQVGGELVTYRLSGALPNANAFWVIGSSAVNAPLFGGTLVPSADIIVPAVPLGPTGEIELLLTWPVGLPPGFTFYYQFWVLDPGGPEGLSASNAISGTTH